MSSFLSTLWCPPRRLAQCLPDLLPALLVLRTWSPSVLILFRLCMLPGLRPPPFPQFILPSAGRLPRQRNPAGVCTSRTWALCWTTRAGSRGLSPRSRVPRRTMTVSEGLGLRWTLMPRRVTTTSCLIRRLHRLTMCLSPSRHPSPKPLVCRSSPLPRHPCQPRVPLLTPTRSQMAPLIATSLVLRRLRRLRLRLLGPACALTRILRTSVTAAGTPWGSLLRFKLLFSRPARQLCKTSRMRPATPSVLTTTSQCSRRTVG